jgi:prepilin-type N-terminal cleavage/methylation domain-containing protein
MTRAPDVRDERGFTLVEMVMVCAMLGVVLSAITTVFIGASHAELNLNTRFRAQEAARVALTLIRKDARNACVAKVTSGTSVTFATAVVNPASSIDATTVCGKTAGANLTMVTWCVLASPTALNQYALYRNSSSTCNSSSKLVADNLINTGITGFTAFFTSGTTIRYGELATIDVDLPVKIPSSGNGVGQPYRLSQRVALRNTVWPASSGTACSVSVPCTAGPCTTAGGCPYAWN